jgi:hypothetical protein
MTIYDSNQAQDEFATTTHTDNKCLNSGAATGAHLGNLGGAASDRLNYTGLDICVGVLEFSGLMDSKGALAFVPSKGFREAR